ncbi:hypothetical protein C2G38_2225049 [Gigaspora rosea]|uniref:Amino acid/polyamine transporter I n=1 Tax=Gigaspora rosea TaxID=44941 RepID=A0A397U2Q6_9GLOM|nr:hypothetical protein C2G38_2225049 [Gigaspora rosea]
MNNNRSTRKTFLGILRGIGYNINYIIGQDAFNPGNIWMLVQSPGITLVLYIICFFISLLGSSVYIELGIRSLPSGIGEQKYITDAFFPRRNFGHVFSFVAIFIMFPSLIVAESFNSSQYFLYCFRKNLNVDWIVSDIVNQTLAIFKIIILLIISVIGLTKLKLNTNLFNWNNIFNASFDFGAYVLLAYEGCLSNAAFITVVGYPNNSTDNESTPMPMRFGKELFGENGENFIAILVAISTFGCVSALIFTYSRIIKYAAETRFIPSLFNSYRANYNTLFNQLWAQFLYCSILSVIFLIKMNHNISNNVSDLFSNASMYAFTIYHGASALCLCIIKIRLNNTNPRIFSIPICMVIFYLSIIIFIIIALLVSPSDGSFDYLISYCISWVAVALGLIFWYVRNQWQANRELIQNQGSNNETETIDETDRDEGSNDEEV